MASSENSTALPAVYISAAQRVEIEGIVSKLIDLLDAADGDPDRELNGDAEPDDEREPERHEPGSQYNPPSEGWGIAPRHYSNLAFGRGAA